MGPETGFGFLRKEIDDFCGIAMATSIGLEVEDRGLGMVEAKRLEQAMGEVNHKEGEATVIVSATFGHLQDSSLELNTLKPCPIWITPY